MMETGFDVVLALMLLGVGGWSIIARNMMTAVIIFIAYGLLLSLAWVRLHAVDVSLTEAAIGSGATGLLMVIAAHKVAGDSQRVVRLSRGFHVLAAVFATLVAIGIASLAFVLPGAPVSLAAPVLERLPESGLGNPVAGVLFVYRSFDTLLEKVVLLLALIGVWALARDQDWGGVPGLRLFQHPHSVLMLLARTLPPIGFVFAIYMTWAGADVPGGAFQGGTVLAAMWILVMVAGVRRVPRVSSPLLRLAIVAGPLVFLAIGFLGFVAPGVFLAYPDGLAKPLIVVMEVALTLSIAVILGLLIAGPPRAKDSA
ncbi:sodium:proton antiporter [Aestuariivirga litoralis]|uniref:Sodium:proton antiporter n=1 Tax=Aestuariivirga litoralis TaxID=2650924 RepID=A0A2W2API3_9HYPH|nr:hydrogenase subunit MbhD domain-containing protein [Aestuariivirga litoralis]PZF77305.1 sodium:proton antiporter [Aestuariivirga litoralis]